MNIRGVELNWSKLCRTLLQIHNSEFMDEMDRRRQAGLGAESMGRFDASALYALARLFPPTIAVETGGNTGMSSSFLLKGMADAGVKDGALYSVELDPSCPVGSLIPEEIKSPYRPLIGDALALLKSDAIPAQIDLFLHDSSHRYRHQMNEFRSFWPRIRPGGLLVSHDVNMNASFADFISRTYAHDRLGVTDLSKTRHAFWGRIGNLGFAIKPAT